ncbi:MAG: DUF3088 family protein [Chthoniobacteraceae bacterium]
MKDTLFLLTPGFLDGDGAPYYCPYCTIFEGLLSLYPNLTSQIDVKRVAFAKPRADLLALLGAEHQSCPALVLGAPLVSPLAGVQVNEANGRWFIDEPQDIGNYLSLTYGIPRPH